MSQRFLHRGLMTALAVMALTGSAAWADRHGDGRDDARRDGRSQQSSPYAYQRAPGSYAPYAGDPRDGLPASVRRIQRETGGQVLKAQPYERDGRQIYRVKVLTPQGRIRVYEDDPSLRGPRGNAPMTVYQREPLPQSPPASVPRDGRQPHLRQDPQPYQQRFEQYPPQQPPRGHRRSG